VSLGRQTFVGEIVDSKCFLGVMNPANSSRTAPAPCAASAAACRPCCLVRQTDGTARYLLLVAPDGQPVNQRVLDLVAEPVEITGEVERQANCSCCAQTQVL
jgi:hypothetical protein